MTLSILYFIIAYWIIQTYAHGRGRHRSASASPSGVRRVPPFGTTTPRFDYKPIPALPRRIACVSEPTPRCSTSKFDKYDQLPKKRPPVLRQDQSKTYHPVAETLTSRMRSPQRMQNKPFVTVSDVKKSFKKSKTPPRPKAKEQKSVTEKIRDWKETMQIIRH